MDMDWFAKPAGPGQGLPSFIRNFGGRNAWITSRMDTSIFKINKSMYTNQSNLPVEECTTASQLGNEVELVTVPADKHRGLEYLGGVEEGAAALVTLACLFEAL